MVTSGTSSATIDYMYDGNGQRVGQSVASGSATTQTVYVGNLYEEQLTGTSHPYTVYYYLGAKLVGLRRANQPAPQPTGQARLVGDHLGSTTLLVDTSTPPQVVARQYYTPYGERAFAYQPVGPVTSRDFTGQRLDSDTGLLYYGARYYDPGLAYFISGDAAVSNASNSEDLNRYLYVRGNPLRYVDPSGYNPEDTYVFVFGCSALPQNPHPNCGTETDADLERQFTGDYADYLYDLYKGWQAKYRRFGEDLPDWETWKHDHVLLVAAPTIAEGAANLKAKLIGIEGTASIHLWGHSVGAAAILYYFAEEQYMDYRYGHSDIDSRIASAALVDGPLNRLGDLEGLGDWLVNHTRIKQGGVLQVQVQQTALIINNSQCFSGAAFDCRVADYSHATKPNPPPSNKWDAPLQDAINWHGYSYQALYGTNLESWFARFWK